MLAKLTEPYAQETQEELGYATQVCSLCCSTCAVSREVNPYEVRLQILMAPDLSGSPIAEPVDTQEREAQETHTFIANLSPCQGAVFQEKSTGILLQTVIVAKCLHRLCSS